MYSWEAILCFCDRLVTNTLIHNFTRSLWIKFRQIIEKPIQRNLKTKHIRIRGGGKQAKHFLIFLGKFTFTKKNQ